MREINDFKDIELKYYSFKIFKLLKNNNSMLNKKICRDLKISKDFLNSILSFDNEKGHEKLFVKKIEENNPKNFLFSILLRRQYEEIISLTSFGEELMKKY